MEAVIRPLFPKQIKFAQWTFIKYLYLRQEKKVKLSWFLTPVSFYWKSLCVRREPLLPASQMCVGVAWVTEKDFEYSENLPLSSRSREEKRHWTCFWPEHQPPGPCRAQPFPPPHTHTGHPQSSPLIPPSCCKVSFISAVFSPLNFHYPQIYSCYK